MAQHRDEILRQYRAEFVLDCFDSAKAEGDDQARFRREVTRRLVRLTDLSEEAREKILVIIADLETQIPATLSDSSEIAQAQTLCRQIAVDLDADPRGGAFRTVTATWPAIIAHELAHLLRDLGGGASRPGAVEPSPEAALFQLRDVFETLLKFPVLVMARALIARGSPEDGRFVRHNCFGRLSGGQWLGFGREAGGRVIAAEALGAFHAIARLFATGHPFYRAIDAFLAIRNDEIGHGGRRLDPRETAKILRVTLLGDKALATALKITMPSSLADALAAAIAAAPWRGMTLVADAVPPMVLTGSAALTGWHEDEIHTQAGHQEVELPMRLDLADGSSLDLGPFIRGRICTKCDRRDIFLFDTLYDGHGDGKFDLLDYGRGHKIRRRGRDARDLREALAAAEHDPVVERVPEGALTRSDVLLSLDAARVERHYLSPSYLRQPFVRFLRERPKGIYWLQAPAHIGKTTFVQGLARDQLVDEPIIAEDDPRTVAVAVFFCKKEYREGAVNFIQGLGRAIETALRIPGEASRVLPASELALSADNRPEGFVAWVEAWRDFAAQYQHRPYTPRLLIVIDGLDETDAPNQADSLLHFLPPPEHLPDGVYLLLTSRCPGDWDCPDWLGNALLPLAKPNGVVERVGLDTAEYRALMQRYAAGRLGMTGDDRKFLALFQTIFEKADRRFIYVAFLVERLRQRDLSDDRLIELPVGDELYRDFLDGLDREFHPKLADSIRDVMLVLAAEERAHDWIFAKPTRETDDRATGGKLLPEPERWAGVVLEELARQVELDLPGDNGTPKYDGRFIEVLLRLQPVLGVSRGTTGTPHYSLGLKDLALQIEGHPVLGPELRRVHARLAGTMLDAIDALVGGGAPEREADQSSRSFELGCARLLPHIRLSGSEPLATRWSRERTAAGKLVDVSISAAKRSMRFGVAIADESLLLMWLQAGIGDDIEAASPPLRKVLAGAYMNRGITKASANGHGPSAALQDYDFAISVMEQLRDELLRQGNEAWTAEYRDGLAGAYMNRGNAKRHADGHGPLAALQDHDLAIGVMEQLRDELLRQGEKAWTPEYRNDLARAYMNRGIAKRVADGQGPLAALQDYGLAIGVMEQLRDTLLRQGEDAWTAEYRDSLAAAYLNRGVAKESVGGQDPLAALQDYDLAIGVMEQLRDALLRQGADAWTPQSRNGLAAAYMNRGNAKQNTGGHDPLAVLQDYDLAISVREKLRDTLLRQGEEAWTAEFRNDLANSYMNRANAKDCAGGQSRLAALQDYDLAISVMEELRDMLQRQSEAAWPPEYRKDLARAYMNRGVAKRVADGHGTLAALRDYDLAISVMKELRDALLCQSEAAWTAECRNDFAVALVNRAIALADQPADRVQACADLLVARAIWAAMVERMPMLRASVAGSVKYAEALARQLGCQNAVASPSG